MNPLLLGVIAGAAFFLLTRGDAGGDAKDARQAPRGVKPVSNRRKASKRRAVAAKSKPAPVVEQSAPVADPPAPVADPPADNPEE